MQEKKHLACNNECFIFGVNFFIVCPESKFEKTQAVSPKKVWKPAARMYSWKIHSARGLIFLLPSPQEAASLLPKFIAKMRSGTAEGRMLVVPIVLRLWCKNIFEVVQFKVYSCTPWFKWKNDKLRIPYYSDVLMKSKKNCVYQTYSSLFMLFWTLY